MRPTRVTHLAIVAAVFFILVNLLTRFTYSDLPALPTLAGVTLLVLAVVDGGLAIALRPRFERRKDTEPVHPLTAVRVVSLAKASSVLGALMFGAWVGVLGYVAPESGIVDQAAHDTTASIIGALCALALVGAALWLEHCCRIKEDPDRDGSGRDRDGPRRDRALGDGDRDADPDLPWDRDLPPDDRDGAPDPGHRWGG